MFGVEFTWGEDGCHVFILYKGEGCNAIHLEFVEVLFRFILSF